jgi:hypothetical protein
MSYSQSQSFRPTPVFELSPTVREVIAHMPIVIFAKAMRDAFFRPAKPALGARSSSFR